MPEDRTPEDDQSPSPWAARPATPPDAATEARGRSIFNRFRRDRSAPDLQTHLPFPDEEAAAEDAAMSEAPPIEPARSPWRRPASDELIAAPAQPPARPTPPIEEIEATNLASGAEPAPIPEPASASAAPPATASPAEPDLDTLPKPGLADSPAVAPSPPALEAVPVASAEPAAPAAPAWSTPPAVAASSASAARPLAPVAVPPIEMDPEPSITWGAFRPIPVPVNPYMLLLAGIVTLVTLAYLLVEPSPRWFLILGAVAVAGGLDGTLRATWRVTYRHEDTTPALFMPAIFILAVPPLIEHNVRGLAVIPAGLAMGLAFFAIVAAQVGSARPGASYFPWARTVSIAGTYAAAFAFFSLTYIYDLGIGVAAVATGLVALMLAIEVLREGEIDSTETAGYAAAAGAAVAQWRLALHYLPVDGYLAGLAVVLGFLVVTGLLHAYVTRSLDRRTTIDHAVVAAFGAALVIGARAAGLA